MYPLMDILHREMNIGKIHKSGVESLNESFYYTLCPSTLELFIDDEYNKIYIFFGTQLRDKMSA